MFDKRRILDGLPLSIKKDEHDDSLPIEMSVASMDYLKRHNLLSPRGDDRRHRGNVGGKRSFD